MIKNYHFILAIITTIATNFTAFDWQLYVDKYPDLKAAGINTWISSITHYFTQGFKEGRSTNPENPPLSNFDWHYYVTKNHLSINNEKDALEHYNSEGLHKNLSYCEHYTLVILLHLFDLDQMDEFIEKINWFMQTNPHNTYYIKINIPIDNNIDQFFSNPYNISNFSLISPYPHSIEKFIYDTCANAHYADTLITQKNYKQLYQLAAYLKNGFKIGSDKIQIIFSPNRGRDIGGFFLLMDQLIKQEIKHDFIIKLHTKSEPYWRQLLISFLNIHINPLLRTYECIYSNRIAFDFDNIGNEIDNLSNVNILLKLFNLPQHNFCFCGGTMFIVSRKITDYFKSFKLLELFNLLNDEKKLQVTKDGLIEHAFERFFGYLIDHLGLRTYCLDCCPRKTILTPVN